MSGAPDWSYPSQVASCIVELWAPIVTWSNNRVLYATPRDLPSTFLLGTSKEVHYQMVVTVVFNDLGS